METTAEATGPATAEEVWERYAEPARWPEWAPQITGVETDAERIAPDVTGRLHAPAGVRLDFTVTAVNEEARTWSWSIRFGLFKLHFDHGVQDGADGTTTWMRARGPAVLIATYQSFVRGALENLVRES